MAVISNPAPRYSGHASSLSAHPRSTFILTTSISSSTTTATLTVLSPDQLIGADTILVYSAPLDYTYSSRRFSTPSSCAVLPLAAAMDGELQSFSSSALSRFSSEVLGECFSWCIAGPLPTMEKWTCPTKLTVVCRSWRAVALATPHLWARLHLEVSCIGSEETCNDLDKFSMWLERSRTVPLSYTLSLPADLEDESHITMFRPFIRRLLLHVHHWSDVLIQSSNWDRMKRLSVPKDTAFPHLKRISLWGIDPRSLRFSLTSEQAPSLEAVVLSSPILHAWSLPWAQLQSLRIGLRSQSRLLPQRHGRAVAMLSSS